MIAQIERRDASDTEFPPPMTVGGHTTHSTIDRAIQHPDLRQEFNFRFRQRYPSQEFSDKTTLSLTQSVKTFDIGDSSAAFAFDGLKRTLVQAYQARLDVLRVYAKQDGCCLNPGSETDFWNFVLLVPNFRKGSLVLLDNGNLRVVWKDKRGTHLGMQFLGDEMIQYVIFKRRSVAQQISRVAGRDGFEGLIRQIDAFDLNSLLCANESRR